MWSHRKKPSHPAALPHGQAPSGGGARRNRRRSGDTHRIAYREPFADAEHGEPCPSQDQSLLIYERSKTGTVTFRKSWLFHRPPKRIELHGLNAGGHDCSVIIVSCPLA